MQFPLDKLENCVIVREKRGKISHFLSSLSFWGRAKDWRNNEFLRTLFSPSKKKWSTISRKSLQFSSPVLAKERLLLASDEEKKKKNPYGFLERVEHRMMKIAVLISSPSFVFSLGNWFAMIDRNMIIDARKLCYEVYDFFLVWLLLCYSCCLKTEWAM